MRNEDFNFELAKRLAMTRNAKSGKDFSELSSRLAQLAMNGATERQVRLVAKALDECEKFFVNGAARVRNGW